MNIRLYEMQEILPKNKRSINSTLKSSRYREKEVETLKFMPIMLLTSRTAGYAYLKWIL